MRASMHVGTCMNVWMDVYMNQANNVSTGGYIITSKAKNQCIKKKILAFEATSRTYAIALFVDFSAL